MNSILFLVGLQAGLPIKRFQELGTDHGPGDLAGNEGFAANGRFMVEKNAVAGKDIVGLPVVDRDPVGIDLGGPVRTAGIERGCFLLGNFLDLAEHLTGGSLIKAGFMLQAKNADGLQEAQGAEGIAVGSVFRSFKRNLDMALGGQVVNFIRLDILDDADQVGGIGEIAVVHEEADMLFVEILEKMIHPGGIERRRPTLDAVDFVAFAEEDFSQVGAILAGNTGNQGFFHISLPLWKRFQFSVSPAPGSRKKRGSWPHIARAMIVPDSTAAIAHFPQEEQSAESMKKTASTAALASLGYRQKTEIS